MFFHISVLLFFSILLPGAGKIVLFLLMEKLLFAVVVRPCGRLLCFLMCFSDKYLFAAFVRPYWQKNNSNQSLQTLWGPTPGRIHTRIVSLFKLCTALRGEKSTTKKCVRLGKVMWAEKNETKRFQFLSTLFCRAAGRNKHNSWICI